MRIFANYLCPNFKLELPEIDWFNKRRDGVGHAADIYSWIEVSQAKDIKQMGFDETQIEGVSTMNMWVLIVDDQDRVCQ